MGSPSSTRLLTCSFSFLLPTGRKKSVIILLPGPTRPTRPPGERNRDGGPIEGGATEGGAAGAESSKESMRRNSSLSETFLSARTEGEGERLLLWMWSAPSSRETGGSCTGCSPCGGVSVASMHDARHPVGGFRENAAHETSKPPIPEGVANNTFEYASQSAGETKQIASANFFFIVSVVAAG